MTQEVEVQTLDRRRRVVQQMKDLGVYKPAYDDIITIYAGMLDQYAALSHQYEQSGYKVTEEYTNKAGATNQRKVPILNAIESLRKDIATYSDRLQLNPKANSAPAVVEAGSPLDDFMKNRGDRDE
ncbi:P27 family phage terminase small subunit [Lacticaseibacillus brantae]|uniref:Terminase small subunit n=1 Tax=Lacticaseibacillus brantae DSM 23927 TaxID=1423727 RepID=A0A0R2B9C6_9LACO|nr:P27 family phage terminase small subunit [Lacticaseibacillus brantae]KRM73017.1 hypothetical protein FC34_GL000737 [Lacticaseibacillus brantae DSM 23927]